MKSVHHAVAGGPVGLTQLGGMKSVPPRRSGWALSNADCGMIIWLTPKSSIRHPQSDGPTRYRVVVLTSAQQSSPQLWRIMHRLIAALALLLLPVSSTYVFAQTGQVSRQEMLRGSMTPEREWWDVLHYHLKVEFLPDTKRLKGSNAITFKALKPGNKMQIDLQPPLAITKVTHGNSQLKFDRDGNVYWITF